MTDLKPMTPADCRALDAADPLAGYRERFSLPASGALHFDANSIGAMPADAPARVARLMAEGWRELSRRGWSELDWLDKPKALGAGIAHLLGAAPDDVIVCDNTTINLFKILSYAWRIRENGSVMLTEAHNFPTDLFVAEGLERWLREMGSDCRLVLAETPEDVLRALNAETAILYLTHTDYRNSRRWDMAALTKAAHDNGALAVWDLSHSAGALEIDLMGAGADFAVGCGYKYLCGGPGSPAYLYMHPRVQDRAWPGIAGWMGHADFGAFAPSFEPHAGVVGQATGTPPVIANEVFAAAVDIWREVRIDDVAAKHKSLSTTAIRLLEQECGDLGVRVISPGNYDEQGGHVAFESPGAGSVCEALFDRGMICSFRKPAALRLGLGPLYHSHEDIWRGVQLLKEVLTSEAWRDPKYEKFAI